MMDGECTLYMDDVFKLHVDRNFKNKNVKESNQYVKLQWEDLYIDFCQVSFKLECEIHC